MQLQDFLNAVRQMRIHQVAYFRDRKQSDLVTAKNWEQFVDRGLREGVTVLEHDEHLPEEPKQSSLFE